MVWFCKSRILDSARDMSLRYRGIVNLLKKPEQGFLLDLYPNAVAAYSLRKLNSSYNGNCIQVRRSSDNATQDINFHNNEVNVSQIQSFVGSNSAYVTIWYDQSGNGRDLLQTNNTNQPRIMLNGNIDVQNGKPTIFFNGSNNYFNRTQTLSNLLLSSNTTISVCNAVNGSSRKFILETTTSLISPTQGVYNPGMEYDAGNPPRIRYYSGQRNLLTNLSTSITFALNNRRLIIGTKNGSSYMRIFVNGVQRASVNNPRTATTNINGWNVGTYRFADDRWFGGNMQELILYNSYIDTDRSGIENNINNFYSIY